MSDKVKDIRLVVETKSDSKFTFADAVLAILCLIALYFTATGGR